MQRSRDEVRIQRVAPDHVTVPAVIFGVIRLCLAVLVALQPLPLVTKLKRPLAGHARAKATAAHDLTDEVHLWQTLRSEIHTERCNWVSSACTKMLRPPQRP